MRAPAPRRAISDREPRVIRVVDTTKYCTQPVRTQLKVTATDVLISVATLLIYTPHTPYVTCPDRRATARRAPAR